MAVIYRIEPSLGLLYYVALDECTGAQFIQTALEATQNDHYHPNLVIIFDLLLMTDLNFDIFSLHQAVKHTYQGQTIGKHTEKTAIITRSTFASDLLSALELMTPDTIFDWKIFPDLLWALPWLGLSESTLQVFQARDNLITANNNKGVNNS